MNNYYEKASIKSESQEGDDYEESEFGSNFELDEK